MAVLVGYLMLRLLSAVFAALFLLGVGVQLNDPDPLRWILLYLAAATASLLAAAGRNRWPLPAATALVALAWAAILAPGALGEARVTELVGAWEMKDSRVEEGREAYGLLIVFAWMAVLALAGLRNRRSVVPRGGASIRP